MIFATPLHKQENKRGIVVNKGYFFSDVLEEAFTYQIISDVIARMTHTVN